MDERNNQNQDSEKFLSKRCPLLNSCATVVVSSKSVQWKASQQSTWRFQDVRLLDHTIGSEILEPLMITQFYALRGAVVARMCTSIGGTETNISFSHAFINSYRLCIIYSQFEWNGGVGPGRAVLQIFRKVRGTQEQI